MPGGTAQGEMRRPPDRCLAGCGKATATRERYSERLAGGGNAGRRKPSVTRGAAGRRHPSRSTAPPTQRGESGVVTAPFLGHEECGGGATVREMERARARSEDRSTGPARRPLRRFESRLVLAAEAIRDGLE